MNTEHRYKRGILVLTVAVLVGVSWGTDSGRSWIEKVTRTGPFSAPDQQSRLLHLGGGETGKEWPPELVAKLRAELLPTDAPTTFETIYSRWPDEETTYELRPVLRDHARKHWDPIALDRPFPNITHRLKWPEHSEGEIRLVTNEYGMRRDDAVPREKSCQRVLVMGDSHTYGLVNNRESFASLLEARLAEDASAGRPPESAPADVFNIAVSSTGPFEYLGSFLRFAELQPDVVVCVLFTGNDFRNAVPFLNEFGDRRTTRWSTQDEMRRGQDVRQNFRAVVAQGFGQAHSFKHQDGDAERALDATIGCFIELNRLAIQRRIALIVVVLPTKLDVEADDDRARADSILAALEISREEYDVNRNLGARFASAMRLNDIRVIELYPSMLENDTPLFWRRDYHLNVAGHEHVAAVLFDSVRTLLQHRR